MADKITENVAMCSVCQERFHPLQTLDCQHSFCVKCIGDCVNSKEGLLTCLTCRKFEVGLPGKALRGSTNNMNEKCSTNEEEVNYCLLCNENVTARCMDCSKFFCTECVENHQKIPSCQSHTVMTLEQYQSMNAEERAAAKPLMCPEHSDVTVKFYCVDCSLPVCMDCTVVSHKQHDIKDQKTVIENLKKEANTVLSYCLAKEMEMKKGFDQHLQDTEAQNQSVAICKEDIERFAEELHQLIDDSKQQVLDKLAKQSKSALQNSEAAKNEKEEKLSQLHEVLQHVKRLVQAPCSIADMTDASEILKKAKQMSGQRVCAVAKGKSQTQSFETTAKRGADGSNSAIPFCFEERKPLKMFLSSKPIGTIEFKQNKQPCTSTSKQFRERISCPSPL
ncbi:E3 ubiquitin-protein ligase TRIM33-like [Anneissia japonica]|uniref:E3 ubiquitin-protein ligase TRIM33-like n=1 Tax=Anneissia japonica TaxID=1529436 RepID=UPI00142550A0|nr:E3 ubiquitin-protein ligase TRIM33-like [Anneissia japonica]